MNLMLTTNNESKPKVRVLMFNNNYVNLEI